MLIRLLILVAFGFQTQLADPAQGESQDPVPYVIRGEVRLPDGSPAVGAGVALHGLPGSRNRALRSVPKDWSDPEPVVIGEDGRFEFSLRTPEDFAFGLHATLEGHVPEGRRWGRQGKGGEIVLEPIRLAEACWVVGHVQDRKGALVVGNVRVIGNSVKRPEGNRERLQVTAEVDPDTGGFRIGPFRPGAVSIYAEHNNRTTTRAIQVMARVREGKDAVLRFTGVPPDEKILVDCFPNPDMGARLGDSPDGGSRDGAISQLVLLDENGAVVRQARRASGRDAFEFIGVPVGEYTIELRDPRFERQRIYRVLLGEVNQIPLVGSSAIELEVLDADGNRVDRYGLTVGYANPGRTPSRFEILSAGSLAPTNGRFDSIVPGDLYVEVTTPDGYACRRELGSVEPGKTLRATLRLDRPAAIRGVVLDGNGKPAAGTRLEVTRGAHAGLPPGSHASIQLPDGTAQWLESFHFNVATDADGSFAIENLDSGPWSLRAVASPHAWTTRTLELTAGGVARLDIRLPQLAEVRGCLRVERPFDFTRLRVWAESSAWVRQEDAYFRPRTKFQPKADGTFAFDGLPIGDATLHIALTQRPGKHSYLFSVGPGKVVSIAGGDVDWELNITDLLPVLGEAVIRLDGKPAPTVHIALVEQAVVEQRHSAAPINDREVSFTAALKGGVAGVVAPEQGVVYRALLRSNHSDWVGDGGTVGPFGPGEEIRATLDLDLCRRTLQVLDSDRSPLAHTEVGWACLHYQGRQCHGTTDGQGRIEVGLPAGLYTLFRHGAAAGIEVEFTMERGVGPIEVVLH